MKGVSTISFDTCSYAKSLLMHNLYPPKIVHVQDFCMGTCIEGKEISQLGAPLLQ